MQLQLKTTPTCPHCPNAPANTQPYQTTFFVEDGRARCAGCGNDLDLSLFKDVDVPEVAGAIIKALICRNMMRCDTVHDSGDNCGERRVSAPSLSFHHRVHLILGTVSWCEVPEYVGDFKPHETDFAAIRKHAPLVAAMIDEFLAAGFVVSEAPGKSGERLRNASIRFVKWDVETTGLGASKVKTPMRLRASLTWDMDFRNDND